MKAKRWSYQRSIISLALAICMLGGGAVLAVPSEVCIQGTLSNNQGPLYGTRLWRVQYYDSETDGNALGGPLSGSVVVDSDGRWAITLTPPAEVVQAAGDVWYELSIDSSPAPDGRLHAEDVFPDRVKVESVLFAQRAGHAGHAPLADEATTASVALAVLGDAVGHADMADQATTASVALNAQLLGGLASADFATTSALAGGLAGKSDTGHVHDDRYYTESEIDGLLSDKSVTTHTHNLQDLGGAVTDAQVPDDITVNHASTAGSADSADTATTASVALNAQLLGGLASADFATTSALASGLAGKSDTSHSHNLQDLGGAVTDAQVPNALTISGGTVNNTPIGATTPASGAFTTLESQTLDTGQGAGELYAMNQNVRTSDDVAFSKVTATTATFGSNSVTIDDDVIVGTGGQVGIGTASPAGLLHVAMSGGSDTLDMATGGTASVSDANSSTADDAFDDSSTFWFSNYEYTFATGDPSSSPAWLQYQLAAPVAIRKYRINDGGSKLRSWRFLGSHNGTDWTTLHTVTNYTHPGDAWNDFDSSDFTNETAWTYYRWVFDALQPNNTYMMVREAELIEGAYSIDTLVATAAGQVGVGTDLPSEALEVQGVVKVNDTTDPPSTTTARLYNNGGNLYWNGTQLDAAGSGADFKSDGSVAMTGDLDMGGNGITNLGTDIADGDVADNLTISGGTINNTAIGGSTPAAGTFSSLRANGGIVDIPTAGMPPMPTSDKLYNMSGSLFWGNHNLLSHLSASDGDPSAVVQVDQNGATTVASASGQSLTILPGGDSGSSGQVLQNNGSGVASWGYSMDQNLRTTDGPLFATIDTGQGANELYAMNQDVQTTDDVQFSKATLAPQATLDQNNFPVNFHFGLPSTYVGAQVFTAGASGNLTRIDLSLGYTDGTATNVDVSIYSGNTPAGGSLLSSVETVYVDNHYTSPETYEVVFATPASVASGQQYHVRIVPATQNIGVGGQTSDNYAGGTMWSGGSEYTGYDYGFRTYVAAGGDVLEAQGVIQVSDTTNPPDTTTDRLYNNGGNLFWNGTQLGGGDFTADGSAPMTGDLDMGGNNITNVGDEVQLPSTGAVYLGDPATDGTWRIVRSGNNLAFERRETGAWVSKTEITP